ncbi:MAG: energy-coupling factor transporter transmembrane protein EcfT [Defluviitaleaceae bacterium]|nr:energy-coupling factor transporter transmembrane protein EcfT [Defluviitaleaceae bacterium]
MTRITVGNHYPTGSILHRTDPRVKLAGTVLYVTALLFVNNFLGFILAAVFIAALIKISKVPPRLIFRGLRMIFFMLVFAASINIFFTSGQNVLLHFGIIRITTEGLTLAAHMIARLVLIVTGTSMLTLTSTPIQLTDGIESGLRPLKVIKVPVHDIAMIMTIAMRSIPNLSEEMDKIMKAQKARGAELDTGSLTKRALSLVPILVPLFVSAFKWANELATAMEARCYRGDINRTRMKEMKMNAKDWAAAAIMLASVIAIAGTRWVI